MAVVLAEEARRGLEELIGEAHSLGLVGPAPPSDHVEHALGFARGPAPKQAVDLGSGAGLPGLVLAQTWPGSRWVLLDSNERRSAFAAEAATRLGLAARVVVRCERAEEAARTHLRGIADLVVARGFGPPAVTAECGAPLLAVGGRLIVSEPPGGRPARWPAEELVPLGVTPGRTWSRRFSYQELQQETPCPDRYPRRTGVPAKRPLFIS